jgi:hypothetical protein
MLLTYNLSKTETVAWHTRRAARFETEATARRLATLRNRRFAQLVSYAGNILAIVEVEL